MPNQTKTFTGAVRKAVEYSEDTDYRAPVETAWCDKTCLVQLAFRP